MKTRRNELVIYLAVMPAYRTECAILLQERLGERLRIIVSAAHLDASVKTGIPRHMYDEVALVRVGASGYLQIGRWLSALRARSTLLDLNPRSISAWVLLLLRRILKRRTVLWGHLHGRDGAGARTARLRSFMRNLADGFVAYTHSSGAEAADMGDQPVWVAPNSLYSRAQLERGVQGGGCRHDAVYVGRFEKAKKVPLALEGFAEFARTNRDARLVLVGGGSLEAELRARVAELDLENRVIFRGWVNDFDELASIYSSAFCSLSPGFIGLGLTQSLGFGVPQLASRNEPHSPEVELAATGGVDWFETDDPSDLARKLGAHFEGRAEVPQEHLREYVAARYSADSMAKGIADALEDVSAEEEASHL